MAHTTVRCDPVVTVPGFDQVVHPTMRQTVSCRVIRERIAVEARETLVRCDPDKASRVLTDSIDVIIGKAVCASVRSDGKTFTITGAREEDERNAPDTNTHEHPHADEDTPKWNERQRHYSGRPLVAGSV